MKLLYLIAIAGLSATSALHAQPTQKVLTLTPYTFVSSRGDTVLAELGTLRVPENRTNPRTDTITVAFVRFRSTAAHPGPPIVYLAGGPGQSGISAARGSRFPLFMKFLEVSDVIALDQRGVGKSTPRMDCPNDGVIPYTPASTRASEIAVTRAAALVCARSFRARQIPVAGMTTEQNADDLESLRQALGVERLNLWAISYGTHLALSALRRHPDSFERVVLAGVEGPDHTYKLPANTELQFAKLERLMAADSVIHANLPNPRAALRTIVDRLNHKPVLLRIPDGRTAAPNDTTMFAFGDHDFLGLVAGLMSDGTAIRFVPAVIAAAQKGDFMLLARLAAKLEHPRAGESFGSAMSLVMDCASGVSPSRLRTIRSQARSALFMDVTNPPTLYNCDAWGVPPLPATFRSPVRSDVATMFISGTLDLNTPPTNAEEVRRGFPLSSHLILENASHSDPLFLSSPQIGERMLRFFRGEVLGDATIRIPFSFAGLDMTPLEAFVK